MSGKTSLSIMLGLSPKRQVEVERMMMRAFSNFSIEKKIQYFEFIGPGWYGDSLYEDDLGFFTVDRLSICSKSEAEMYAWQYGYTNIRYAEKESDL